MSKKVLSILVVVLALALVALGTLLALEKSAGAQLSAEIDSLSALTEAQVQYVAGSRNTTGNNGNVYVTRAEDYDLLQQGYMADGTSFDEILGLDMLENDIQLNVMDLLAQSRKVPQTAAGVASIINVINQACDKHVRTGFIAPGQWNGAQCLELMTGDYLDAGYLVQSDDLDSQPQADRDKRICPTIYVCVKLAGAIEFVVIEVNVNR